jgi:hypothetical protein
MPKKSNKPKKQIKNKKIIKHNNSLSINVNIDNRKTSTRRDATKRKNLSTGNTTTSQTAPHPIFSPAVLTQRAPIVLDSGLNTTMFNNLKDVLAFDKGEQNNKLLLLENNIKNQLQETRGHLDKLREDLSNQLMPFRPDIPFSGMSNPPSLVKSNAIDVEPITEKRTNGDLYADLGKRYFKATELEDGTSLIELNHKAISEDTSRDKIIYYSKQDTQERKKQLYEKYREKHEEFKKLYPLSTRNLKQLDDFTYPSEINGEINDIQKQIDKKIKEDEDNKKALNFRTKKVFNALKDKIKSEKNIATQGAAFSEPSGADSSVKQKVKQIEDNKKVKSTPAKKNKSTVGKQSP